mgnify:CR=1 FL=1
MDLEDNNKILEGFIFNIIKQYNIEYNTNLSIESIILESNKSSDAKFLAHDLYANKLIMYVDEEIWDYRNEYITSIIYHELTHAADSQKFSKLSEDNFFEIMKIYSETHAPQIQLEKMLSYCKEPKMDSFLYYNDGQILLESFIQQSLDKITEQINHLFDEINIIPVENNDITYAVYYLSGYLLALKNKGIEYNPDFSNIPEKYKSLITEIIEYLSSMQCEEYDIAKIQDYHNTLSLLIEEDNKVIQERYDNLVKQMIANDDAQQRAEEEERNTVKCPRCGGTQITTGQRGYSLFSGFLGSNKTVNRCANCGYSWKPGK